MVVPAREDEQMAFKHRGHRHDTVAAARACEATWNSSVERAQTLTLKGLPDGIYSVPLDEDANGYLTMRIVRQAADDSFMPDRQILGYLSGPDNESQYVNFAHLDEHDRVRIWKRFRAGKTFSDALQILANATEAEREEWHSGRCARCGRTLTVPASKNMGYGPKCAEAVGLA